ncbi:hypothetical protein TrVE_jg690 [Triparma verrucosa]|uniref:Uncharacterized protein n=1 Tax=Triparma verrucosa TaxID=1606542 RepID=A0A9W6Z9Q9_9STRA|nr:hypothetical protein TrVE_jg690 [Triparma verrucosa]
MPPPPSSKSHISSCSGFTYYTPSPPTYTCYGVRSSITSPSSSLPSPPLHSKSLCAGYAVYEDGGGAICGLGMQFIVGSKSRQIDKEAIMNQGRRDNNEDPSKRIAEIIKREMGAGQSPTQREKNIQDKVQEKVKKQVESHSKYAKKLGEDIVSSLGDEFPTRMGKAAGRVWDRKEKTVEDMRMGAKKIWGKGEEKE